MSSRSGTKVDEAARRERRKFTAESKQEAVRLMYERRAAGVRVKQIALDLEVRPEQLREWARQLGDRPGVGRGASARSCLDCSLPSPLCCRSWDSTACSRSP